MFFTQEDYRKIEEYLKQNSKKDTDFEGLDTKDITPDDSIAIVHNQQNRSVNLFDLLSSDLTGFFTRERKLFDEKIKELDYLTSIKIKELQRLIKEFTIEKVGLTNQFGNSQEAAISQQTLTNAINAIWKEIRDMKGEVNQGITVTITPDWFISEDTAQVNILAQANDGVFEKLQIYINDTPVWEKPLENVQRYAYTTEMNETSKVVTKAQILGIEYTDEQYVTKYYPFFIGSGQDWEDIINDKYARELNHGKIGGGYNINIENEGDYMFIIIPTSREHEIVRFDMNGYEIPMVVINNQKYTIYKSANTYRKGLFQIDITTNCECDNCE